MSNSHTPGSVWIIIRHVLGLGRLVLDEDVLQGKDAGVLGQLRGRVAVLLLPAPVGFP
jgi:hypothetical protein